MILLTYRYFDLQEFKCNCCSEVDMDDDFVRLLDELRHKCGFPFFINSGYRCKSHNANVGGVDDSAHTKGTAADIVSSNSNIAYEIISNALSFGINRIGIGVGFIHLDVDNTKPKHRIWRY